jgi:hypothetical protein
MGLIKRSEDIMQDTKDDEVLATVAASPGRRGLGIVSLSMLGVLLLYVALATPPALGWQIFLVLTGAGVIWLANALRLATSHQIELTETELRDTSGVVIARVEDIASIDRGFFAFKPSNGFLLRTKTPGPRTWHPGMWWRFGRQIGVGGMTPGHQSKLMSEIIAVILARREMG